ncbi:MAG: PaaI family thioesterase [bacterium]
MAPRHSLHSEGFNPFGDLIGLKFTACRAGYSRCALEVRPGLLNPHGVVHGGVLYSMADTGMGAALYPGLAEDELCATVEVKIAYFVAVRSGTLTCDTTLLHKGKTLAVLESEMKEEGRPVAKAMGTYSIFKTRKKVPE